MENMTQCFHKFPRHMLHGKITALFLTLILISLIHASLEWTFEAPAPIKNKPVVFNKNILVTSQDGTAYLLSTSNGRQLWKRQLDGYPKQPVLFQNEVVIGTSNGKVYSLDKDGEIKINIDLKSKNITTIYGVANTSTLIYATTDGGLYSITKNGEVTLINNLSGTMTAPIVSDNVVLGLNDKTVAMKKDGKILWQQETGQIWTSGPAADDRNVYLGTVENKLVALYLDDGKKRWEIETDGWIMGDITSIDGIVYFGTNGGTMHAVNANNGNIIWKTTIHKAIKTSAELGQIGGRTALLAGSDDGSVYAFGAEEGEILWKFQTKDIADEVLYHKDVLYFGSHDNTLYAYGTERACTINTPEENSVVGYKEVKISGFALSKSGGESISLKIGELDWKNIDVNNGRWSYILDPSTIKVGQNTISCRVSDGSGEETEPFSSISISRSDKLGKGKLKITAPKNVETNKEFTIFVNDAANNEPIDNFKMLVDENEITGNGNVTIKLSNDGTAQISIMKTGFEDYSVKIDVTDPSKNGLVVPIIIGVILILVVMIVLAKIKKK